MCAGLRVYGASVFSFTFLFTRFQKAIHWSARLLASVCIAHCANGTGQPQTNVDYYFSIFFCALCAHHTYTLCSHSVIIFCTRILYLAWTINQCAVLIKSSTLCILSSWCGCFRCRPRQSQIYGDGVCVHSHSQCQYIKPELIRIDRLVKRNLNEFIEILQSDRPLFCVDAVLSTPHISLQPTGVEVCNTIMQVVNGFLERYGTHKRFEFLALCCQRCAKKEMK